MLTRYGERNLVWVDLIAPTAAEIRSVMKEFEIAPVVAEELTSASFRSKVEQHGNSLFVVMHFPAPRGTGRGQQEIDFIIGKNFLITARYETIEPLHAFAKAFEVNGVLGNAAHSHGGHLFVAMAKALYKGLTHECEAVARKLEEIEEDIFRGKEREMVVKLSHAGKLIHDFRQALNPHQDILESLEPLAGRLFGHEFLHYLESLQGTLGRVRHAVENLRDSLKELRATNDSLLNTKQNEIMKTLTIMAFVTFPLTLVSSIFGMNTDSLPIVGREGDFWIIVGIMGLLALSFFYYFKKKRWL